jgi:DNA polymerase/3'-5' exonuclease PolX
MKLAEAKILAEEVKQNLAPYCERIEIAGSVRREKPDGIKDLELVAIPKFAEEELAESRLDSLLFGGELPPRMRKINLLDRRVSYEVRSGIYFAHGNMRGPKKNISAPFSERYYALKYKAQPLDLFVCLPPAQYGVVKVLRTGSREFNIWLVEYGKPKYYFMDGAIVTHAKNQDEWRTLPSGVITAFSEPIPTPEEMDVFKVLGLPWIEPKDRSLRGSERLEEAVKRWKGVQELA